MAANDQLLEAMVNKNADPVPVDPSFQGQICSISTHLPNRILFLNCPGQLYTFLHSAIRVSYRPGIHSQQGQQSILLNGAPFIAPGPGETLGPQVHVAIVRCMLACGWEIACSSSVSLRVPDIHTFFFKKSSSTDFKNIEVCALAFIESNHIRLIDAPVKLLEILKMTIEGHFAKKGDKGAVKFTVKEGVPHFTIKGRVFDASTIVELISTRMLLSQMISKMSASGFEILTSCQARVTNAGMRPQELDTCKHNRPVEVYTNELCADQDAGIIRCPVEHDDDQDHGDVNEVPEQKSKDQQKQQLNGFQSFKD